MSVLHSIVALSVSTRLAVALRAAHLSIRLIRMQQLAQPHRLCCANTVERVRYRLFVCVATDEL